MLRFLPVIIFACGSPKDAKSTTKPAGPTVTLNADPLTIPVDGTTTLSWTTTELTKCTLSSTTLPNPDLAAKMPSGSVKETLGQISATFTLSCSGDNGAGGSAEVFVTVEGR